MVRKNSMIKIDHHPSRRQLTVFGLLWLLFFGVLGGMAWWKTVVSSRMITFWSLGMAIPAAGLLWPEVLRFVYLAATYVTFPIGMVLSCVILAVIYYFVLTPVGLVLRLRGYDPMRRRFDCNAKTYWLPHEPEEKTERYFQQF
jgi:hypothetical protein